MRVPIDIPPGINTDDTTFAEAPAWSGGRGTALRCDLDGAGRARPRRHSCAVSAAPPESFRLALDLHRRGRLAEAERRYRETLADFPAVASVFQNPAVLLRAQRRWPEAEQVLREGLRR